MVLNILEVVTFPPLDPVIVSVKTSPFKSTPAITKLVPVVSCVLVIFIFAPRYFADVNGPSKVIEPDENDELCTKASLSLILL